MSVNATPAPETDEADVPAARPAWQRWALAAALGLPVAAVYGFVVGLLGRALFLGAERDAAALARVTHGVGTLGLLWLIAAATCVVGVVLVMHEVLGSRAARRTGHASMGSDDRQPPSWVWPTVLAGAPVVAIGLAALVTFVAGELSDLPPGGSAVMFAALAGGWLIVIAGVGWLVTAWTASEDDDRRRLDSIEVHWLQQAAAKSYWDLLIVIGAGCLVFSVWSVRVQPSLLLLGVALVAMLDLPVRLWLVRRAEARA